MSKHILRSTMLDVLLRIDAGGFSHLLIDHQIKAKHIDPKDEALLTEVVYGTVQRKLTLDYAVSHFAKQPDKLKPWVRALLRMSMYQMVYLDRVPDHAVIHEAVEIAKERGHKGIASLVNGVLRSVQREGMPSASDIADPVKRLSIETSHPEWLVKRWIEQYGQETARRMCESNLVKKPLAVRVQPLRISREEAIRRLKEEGYETSESLLSEQGIIIEKGNVLRSELFKKGMLTVQDQSSMLVAEMLDLEPGYTVLDACSAPGGKTTHIAEKMHDEGTVCAFDIHEKKAKLVTRKAEELGLSIIEAKGYDARKLGEQFADETFDRILVDAPCSGLGVARGKPDIKYSKREEDIYSLAQIQATILSSVAPLLKKTGKMVYSTCTVDKTENEEVVRRFLTDHPDYQLDESFFDELPAVLQGSPGLSQYGLQLFPQTLDTDGFFLVRFVRKAGSVNN